MNDEIDKYKHYILKNLANTMKILKLIIYLLIIIASIKVAFRYFAPFIFAVLISLLIKPITSFFRSFKLGRGISVALSMILVYGGLIYLFIFAITKGLTELVELTTIIPEYSNIVYNYFISLIQEAENLYIQLPPDMIKMLTDLAKSIFDKVGVALSSGTKSMINALSALPRFAIFFIISTVATFFISKDEEKITNFILRQFPTSLRQKFIELKNNLFRALVGFLKAQMIILSITFIESLIGLNIIGIKYAFIISIFVSIVDILPVLGTGSIYVPWGIISILMGNIKLGLSLLILYGVIVVVRYLIEPRVVGYHLGIHPLIALMSMFVGIKLFGVGGVILGPTIVVIIKATQSAGILPKFK